MKQEVYNMFGNILKTSNVRFLKERKISQEEQLTFFTKIKNSHFQDEAASV